jgi:hypothetical protein
MVSPKNVFWHSPGQTEGNRVATGHSVTLPPLLTTRNTNGFCRCTNTDTSTNTSVHLQHIRVSVGRNSLIGKPNRYGMDCPRGGGEGGAKGAARFPAPVHTVPAGRPASYTLHMGSFLGVKRPGHCVHHSPLASAEVKEKNRAPSSILHEARIAYYARNMFEAARLVFS